MPYHSTSGSAADTADLITLLQDFLTTTVGWS